VPVRALVTDELERRHAVIIASYSFAIEDAGARAQAGQRLDDQREAAGEVVAWSRIKPHSWPILAGDNPEPDMQPRSAGRQRFGFGGVFLYAFDLIELNGDDLRRDPLEVRKATLRSGWPKLVLACASTSISKATAQPCSRTLAVWASKASSRSARTRCIALARSPDWLKMKNPTAPAVKREAEEDWRHHR